MTHNEARYKLDQANELIFEVERLFPLGEYPRLFAYQARCKVGDFMNAIREKPLPEITLTKPKPVID
jgi:hypothetical protein